MTSSSIHIKQAHKIAAMVEQLKAGAILRGAIPQALVRPAKQAA